MVAIKSKKKIKKIPLKTKVQKNTVKKTLQNKVTKKAPVQKTAVKKVATRSKKSVVAPKKRKVSLRKPIKKVVPDKKTFIVASGNDRFWVVNGPVLSSMNDLYEALLHTLLPEQYLYHAMGAQNDFADWVEDSLDDVACARKLRGAEDQFEAATFIKRRFRYYQ